MLKESVMPVVVSVGIVGTIVFNLYPWTAPATARHALTEAGYTHIHIEGHAWFSCSEDDVFQTKFRAVNQRGKTISGVVCSGFLKGATIRY